MTDEKTTRDVLPRDVQLRALGTAGELNDRDAGRILDTLHACGFRIAAGHHITPAVQDDGAREPDHYLALDHTGRLFVCVDGDDAVLNEMHTGNVAFPVWTSAADAVAGAERDDGVRVAVPLVVFQRADTARTAYLRDVDANDQIGALDTALAAAFAAADAVAGAGQSDPIAWFWREKATGAKGMCSSEKHRVDTAASHDYEVFPVFRHADEAAAGRDGDALDAARYRWLRSMEREAAVQLLNHYTMWALDDQIDKLIAASLPK